MFDFTFYLYYFDFGKGIYIIDHFFVSALDIPYFTTIYVHTMLY